MGHLRIVRRTDQSDFTARLDDPCDLRSGRLADGRVLDGDDVGHLIAKRQSLTCRLHQVRDGTARRAGGRSRSVGIDVDRTGMASLTADVKMDRPPLWSR